MKYRFAVIGYGFIGRRHVETLKGFKNCDCVAVCDINSKRLNEAKRLHREIEVYDHIDKLIKSANINGVVISANNNQHKELVIKAARAGLNIICEQPTAMSVKDFDEMMTEVEKADVHFTVHQQKRLDKDFQIIKKCYDDDFLGDICTIKSSLCVYNGNMRKYA